jgi:error-prone DNA polymerase
MTGYAELQATSNFSFLRGASHPQELVAAAKGLGLAALALTDRNSLAGVVRAHVAAKEVGLSFIVGARLDLEDGTSFLAWPGDRAAYGRLTRLLTVGQRRAEKGRCLLRLDDVVEFQEGLILALLPPEGWPGEAFEATLALSRRRLPGALYLAAQRRFARSDRARLARLADLARRHGAPLLATNDVLYHHPARRRLQDVLTCVREKCTLAEAGFRLAANAERHLKDPEEMLRLFAGHERAVERTLEVARAARFSLDELRYEYPEEPVPEGATADAHLSKLAWEGAAERYPAGIPDKVRATIARELALIEKLGYARYFLTVHDIVRFARSREEPILCQGRGSAANSAVCYAIGITSVDPAEIDLLFERFVSEERKEPPDIDVDFEHERREEVIQYIYGRYGRERAGLAATVITYRGRSAVREVGKAMGLSEDTTAALSGIVWGRMSEEMSQTRLTEAGLDAADPLLSQVLDLAEEITGFPRHLSQHVGGFVLTRERLDETVPIGNAAMEDRTVIEWDKDDIDALGILKVDVLALGMLTCIRKCFALIEAWYGVKYSLATVPREDRCVYDMLCRADSVGVFQVESRAQMNMLPRLRPRSFYDLVIEVAIVRPGPIQGDMVHPYLRRRDGIEPEDYPAPHPAFGPPDELKAVLGRTKGVPLFQEQAMKLAMVAAEFTPGELNELRKAMATFRRRGTIGRLEEKMVRRMIERGYEEDFARRCFNQIKGFGEYGFPESHAASFAHLVYVSAWLKCHHPAAFACALLNSQPMGFYAPAQIVRDAREHGVEVRPPDTGFSDWDCTLEEASPVQVSGAGCQVPGARCQVSDTRDRVPGALLPSPVQASGVRCRVPGAPLPSPLWGGAGGGGSLKKDCDSTPCGGTATPTPTPPHKSLRPDGPRPDPGGEENHGLASASPSALHRAGVSVAALERLAAADAFRSSGLSRRQALWEVKALAKARPLPLFAHADTSDAGEDLPVTLPPMPAGEEVVNDYQTLKLSLKTHPMSFLRPMAQAEGVTDNATLKGLRDGQWATIAGIVLVRQRPGSAKGVVFATLEDEFAVANIVVWPKVLERFRAAVMGARLMLIKGRIQRAGDIIHVVANRIEDRTSWLSLLMAEPKDFSAPLARADEVARPGYDLRNPAARHPRNVRVIPKSRDFH